MLTQTDLYLLNPELEIHPILQQKHAAFRLVLNLATGMLPLSNLVLFMQRLAERAVIVCEAYVIQMLIPRVLSRRCKRRGRQERRVHGERRTGCITSS